jgi:RNA polymerase sigma-70 factor (ECF subfamily)
VANGMPGFAQWRPSESGPGYDAFSIHVLEIADGRITGLHFFVDASLFPLFGLPSHLDKD